MRLGDTVENVRRATAGVLDHGIEVGLRMSMIARPTRDEAVAAASELVERLGGGDSERKVEAGALSTAATLSR